MATIVLRSVKGSALTFAEGDSNFSNLNTDKIELTDLSVTSNSASGGGALSYTDSTGVFSYTPPDLTSYIDLTDLSVTSNAASGGGALSYNNTTGAFSYTPPDLTSYIDLTDISVTQNAASGSGTLSYNNTTGVLSYTPPDLTSYIDLTDISVTSNAASGGGALSYNNTTGVFSYTPPDLTSYGTLSNVVEDTTPQLGGNLEVNGNSIVSASAGNITITPDTTGSIVLDGVNWPQADGSANQFLKTNGAGQLSYASITEATGSELENVSEDTTPQLGGDLDVNGNAIVSVSNGNIAITPNGTGQVQTTNLRYDEDIHALGTTSGTITPDVANGNVQTITLSGNLTFNAFSNPIAGQSLTLIIDTNGTSRTLTTTMKTPGATDPTMSTTDTIDICTVFYDGTNYFMNYVNNFG